jgi:transposase
LTRRYSWIGSESYHPAILLALLVYGYASGTSSSRKIEWVPYNSMAFRLLAAAHHPYHDTLTHFRKTFLLKMENWFVQGLALAQRIKLVKLGQISLDGTKIKANASKNKTLPYSHVEKLKAQLREEAMPV